MGEKLLTVEEEAVELRISKSLLHHLMADRKIGFTRLGRRAYFSAGDTAAFLKTRRVEPVVAKTRH